MCTKKNIFKFCLVWSKLLKIFNYGVQVQFSSKLSFSITGIYLNIPAMRAHKVSIMTNLQSHNFTCQTTHCLKYTQNFWYTENKKTQHISSNHILAIMCLKWTKATAISNIHYHNKQTNWLVHTGSTKLSNWNHTPFFQKQWNAPIQYFLCT